MILVIGEVLLIAVRYIDDVLHGSLLMASIPVAGEDVDEHDQRHVQGEDFIDP